jgi:Ca-activated chloride channel family protein
MKFLWPELLWLLLVMPVLVLLYVVILRRKKKAAVRYASLTMVKDALGAGQRFRRHVPPLLFLLAIAVMIVAVARPVAIVTLPSQEQTVILAMDVSGSMRAKDVEPNRLVAAQEAAKAFVAEQPRNVRIGVISFAGTAAVVQPPTRSREDIVAAIDRFQLQRGTAIGSGIIVSLATIFPDAGIDVSELIYGRHAPRPLPAPFDRSGKAEKKDFKPVPPGSYTSAAIILLTDGQRTTGPDSLEAAKMAADRGVRVFTVGIGTPKGEIIGFEGWSFHARLDVDTLKGIANATRGEYFYAGTAADLKKVYESLSARIILEKKETEITAIFSAAAALLALFSALLSLLWFNRIL